MCSAHSCQGCHEMNSSTKWRMAWEQDSRKDVPDFVLDRGISPRDQEIEILSEQEHVNFIEPRDCDVLLDAGCGTGVNILRLHSRVRKIMGIDFSSGSLERCQRKLQEERVNNAHVSVASIAAIPLSDKSVDKILCLSVLQYLDDEEVRRALREFTRVSKSGGVLILHVKNSHSLYWSTLRFAKKLKTLLGWTTDTYYLRPFRWYIRAGRS